MKTIKRIGSLVAVFLLTIYNTCFADVIIDDEGHGINLKRDPGTNVTVNSAPEITVNYVLIGILVLIVVICAAIIIRRIIKKKKENDNNK